MIYTQINGQIVCEETMEVIHQLYVVEVKYVLPKKKKEKYQTFEEFLENLHKQK